MTDEATLERERLGLRHALILGLAQRPLDVPAWLAGESTTAGRLATVAALGLRSRFDHPAAPPHLRRAGFAHEPARLVNRDARAALRRIYGVKKRAVQPAVTLRIIDALADCRACLHPFDYPLLTQLLATNDAALDRNARLWRALSSGADATAASAEDVDDAHWAELKPAERAAHLRSRRGTNPAAARALLATTFGEETAAVRAQLLEAMAVGLSLEDVEFLRGLSSDRADSVRTLARRLVSRIEGTAESNERLSTAHQRLELKSIGILGRRRVLMPDVPKGLSDARTDAWYEDSFAGVSTELLAKRFGLRREQFVEAIADPRLRTLLFGNALALGEHEMTLAMAASLEPGEARRLAYAASDALAALERPRRAELWRAFEPALAADSFEERCAFAGGLYETLRVPAPSTLMDPARTAKPWKRWLEVLKSTPDRDQPDTPELVIALADRAHRAAWRERFSDVSPATASTALALADLFDALDLQSTP